MADWTFVLAGPIGDLGEAGRRVLTEPNVRYVGPVERADLPRVIGHADVALLPLPAGDLHDASFPMKVFDYLALGLPIVGRRTRALADYAGLILDATSVEQYRAALEEGRALARQEAFRGQARETAGRNSWSGRMPALEARVRAALGSAVASGYEEAEPSQVPQGAALRKPAAQSEQGFR
jgi:teichuronic acid biosynthesis glycosyltransferase TuaH